MGERGGRLRVGPLVGAALAAVALAAAGAFVIGRQPRPITVDYPLEGSVFPPDFAAPTLLWRDASPRASAWTIDVSFGDGAAAPLHATSRGEPLRIGEIDPRAVGSTNELPRLTPEQAAAHTWTPDPATWEAIKKRLDGKGGCPHDHRLQRRAAAACRRHAAGSRSGPRPIPSVRPSSTGTCR